MIEKRDTSTDPKLLALMEQMAAQGKQIQADHDEVVRRMTAGLERYRGSMKDSGAHLGFESMIAYLKDIVSATYDIGRAHGMKFVLDIDAEEVKDA